MQLRLLSRSSDLAVLQARMVARTLTDRWPGLEIIPLTRSSAGDRDRRVSLAEASDKGLFTADLSGALVEGLADAVVHSWKDLPIAGHPETRVAATLERADPRDLLLIRRDVPAARPGGLTVLTSSPRRAWQLDQALAGLLPWQVSTVVSRPVRGNVPTRLRKLLAREGDGLVVAKAALDRLLSDAAPAEIADQIRRAMAEVCWMVLPIRDFPTAPAQGALAIEVASNRQDVIDLVTAVSHGPTLRAVTAERAILTASGGGCHEAVGATVLVRDYGDVRSVRGRAPDGTLFDEWSLRSPHPAPPRAANLDAIFPRPDERADARRQPLDVPLALPADADGFWIARAEAAPAGFVPAPHQLVWAAGSRTWHKLAAQGIWVHGCSDSLGDEELPAVDRLAGRAVSWTRLTHEDAAADTPNAIATYTVRRTLPDDLTSRTHFFWTSGSLFRRALQAHPGIARAWHASGPGRTARALRDVLGSSPRVSIWLDYEPWLQHVTR
jgi:hydroxymethylbilane synthase